MVRIIPNRLKSSNNSLATSRSASPMRSKGDSASPEGRRDTGLCLDVKIIQARNLAAKDRGGTSDPYLVLSLGDAKYTTSTIPKTLDPIWNEHYQFPINGTSSLNLAGICWDKDRFGKDYLGEFELALDEAFVEDGVTDLGPSWFPLKSKRTGKKSSVVSGEVELQLTIVDNSNPEATPRELYDQFIQVTKSAPVADTASQVSSTRSKNAYEFTNGDSDTLGIVYLEIGKITDLPPERNVTKTGFDMDPFVVISLGRQTFRTKTIRHNLNPVYNEKMIFTVSNYEQMYSFNFTVIDHDKYSGNDFVASVNLPIREIMENAPKPNPETGLYSLKDIPDYAPVQQKSGGRFARLGLSRTASAQSLSKAARPGLSRQNSTAAKEPSVAGTPLQIAVDGSQDSSRNYLPPPSPGLLAPGENPVAAAGAAATAGEIAPQSEGDDDFTFLTLPLKMKNQEKWESKHNPQLYLRIKYMPYPALRQQFWRALLKQYDADESGRISKVELTTMLDTLGSTLRESTIDSFFQRFPHRMGEDDSEDLTMDEAVICLEDQLEAKSRSTTQGMVDKVKDNVKHLLRGHHGKESGTTTDVEDSETPGGGSQLADSTLNVPDLGVSGEEGDLIDRDDLNLSSSGEEHVVEIKECPICHQPRLNKRKDTDIITHIATCASQDWRQVNNLVMGGFVTSSQAQRKWYSKVITKISYGGYKVGANSANILVQDRITGQINEEKMSVYVRLGIRLLYKGLKSNNMETKRIRKLLKSLSVKQGKKYDDPNSKAEIPKFIQFHGLDLSEVALPLDEFKNFNEFFYRALKPGARPCSAPHNPRIVVSPADCRSVVFNSIDTATNVWIKGREFTVKRLLGDAYPEDVARYEGGALGIFRLAPQDYHRFHIPVDGIMRQPKTIEGEYYTVNPMAIRSALDVYGENVRVLVPIDSPEFGRVMVICVGAMMVGSTVITRNDGEEVKRAEELGYFKFGGSTIVVLFEPGKMVWDEDLVQNSILPLETLIRVGMSVGHAPNEPQWTPDMRKNEGEITAEDKANAKRRIQGQVAEESPEDSGNDEMLSTMPSEVPPPPAMGP
ncbi:phosphatidylserine decarboxylase-domain-containing protein [Sordaria brevicollis]|uniref:Phosphatidylserine decarboxylase proenzyme 2 n=1 Tax=Sordaria brevicollis TaxID=83679 RepID=A0AAE0UGQ8_SORBR|nr:phosphatidylserine decarboxylase-domain-containing protein [Sordaria brevicollis]